MESHFTFVILVIYKMKKSLFHIPKMDCPCEESLIRMKLKENAEVVHLDFNLSERTLLVTHRKDVRKIEASLKSLELGANLKESVDTFDDVDQTNTSIQKKTLWIVLLINFGFFIIEMLSGLLAGSMGLLADSLDMFADAAVYGMSLLAVGAVTAKKKQVAAISGYIQISLAIIGLVEVVRRFLGLEIAPEFQTMIVVSSMALVANISCLWLLQRTKSKEAHIRASIIFSANDVIINLGVIAAALLVWWLQNNLPDLIIGMTVFIIVIRGATRILKLAK